MKKNKQIVPICIILAVAVFCLILFLMIRGSVDEYDAATMKSRDAQQNLQNLKEEDEKITSKIHKDELELRSITPVFTSPANSDGQNLSAFGNLFQKVIDMARTSGLLLRSIEYEMNPGDDPVYKDFSDQYNVCELKFFFVGTYSQLKSFLMYLTNNFGYLMSISRLKVTSFSSNPDYILIKMSVTLYSKKEQQ